MRQEKICETTIRGKRSLGRKTRHERRRQRKEKEMIYSILNVALKNKIYKSFKVNALIGMLVVDEKLRRHTLIDILSEDIKRRVFSLKNSTYGKVHVRNRDRKRKNYLFLLNSFIKATIMINLSLYRKKNMRKIK